MMIKSLGKGDDGVRGTQNRGNVRSEREHGNTSSEEKSPKSKAKN
jgi:hypothetical protein